MRPRRPSGLGAGLREVAGEHPSVVDRHRCRRHLARRRRAGDAAHPRGGEFRGGRRRAVRARHRTAAALDRAGGRRARLRADRRLRQRRGDLRPSTDRILSAHTLSAEVLAELAEITARVIPGAGLAVERVGAGAHDAVTPQFVSSPGYEHAWLNPDNTEVSLLDLLSEPAIKLLIRRTGATSAEMVDALAPHLNGQGDLTYSTDNGLVEVVPHGISKATGVAAIGALDGIDAGRVLTFGDMPNDIAMLTWAGHGVAMGNAHPEVKAAADEVTATNRDNGLAVVLERLFG
ncbi:HAD hydrolase family protein [Mycolicibacterium insubricum]|nr:HAD hydrolase family protein [Mycolicibacterium insubricum]